MSHIGKPPCDSAAVLHAAPSAPCAIAQRRWTLVAAVLGSAMAFVDGTLANVALPALQHAFDADASQLQWVIEAYSLMLAALLLVGGALGDRFGRRRIFVIGVAIFVVASLACAVANSMHQLVAARGIQGIGAALLVPGSLALISATYPQAERGRAIGIWSAWSGVAAALGPVLGGYLVDHYSWRWAFAVNLPVGALLLLICRLRVPESRSGEKDPVDSVGALLATLALAGIVFALIEAPRTDQPAVRWIVALAAGVVGGIAFVLFERRAHAPMLPLSLFKARDFSGTNLLTLLLYGALGGGLYFVPLVLIQVQGLSATAAGAALLPFVAIMFLLSGWAGGLVDRFGPRPPLIVGPLIAAIGFAAFALPAAGANYWSGFLPAVCVLGLGMAVTVAPLTTTVMNAVGAERAGTASGVNNAVARAAGLLAIAAFGIVMARVFELRLAEQLQPLGLSADVVAQVTAQHDKLAALTLPAGLPDVQAQALRLAVGDAFIAGFRRVMLLCAALCVLAALSAWTLIAGIGARPTPHSAAPRTR